MKLPLVAAEKDSFKKRDSIASSSFTPKAKKTDTNKDSQWARFSKTDNNSNTKRDSVMTPTNHRTNSSNNNNKFTKLLITENEGTTTANEVLKNTQKSTYQKESSETSRKMEEALRKKKQLENELQAVSMDIKSLESTQSPTAAVKNTGSNVDAHHNKTNALSATTRTSSSK